MKRAHCRDAARTQKFFVRVFVAPPEIQDSCVLQAKEDWMGHYAKQVICIIFVNKN